VPGLFASGECSGGVHGANRLPGNAYAEMLVFGARSGRFAAEYARKAEPPEIDEKQVEKLRKAVFAPLERKEGARPIDLRKRIQDLALIKVGPVRTELGLKETLEEIENMKKEISELYVPYTGLGYNREWVEALQVKAMLLVLEMTARAALMRTESRGSHYRRDYPDTDYKNWTKNIIVRQVDGKMHLVPQPAVLTKLKPPEVKVPYGVVPEPLEVEKVEKN
jgi:succinate dehydrogenase/fumarate reductase flavoprotein subunit